MPLLWGDLRTQIRRTILNDTSGSKFSNEVLLDSVHWALQTFCQHTAVATSVAVTGDGTTRSFALPDNVYVSPELAGSVYIETSGTYQYFTPRGYNLDNAQLPAWLFYTRPDTLIHFVEAPADVVMVDYYAYYNAPYVDANTIDVPVWAQAAIAYLTAAYALSKEQMVLTGIRGFSEKPDTGGPEDNPYIKQQEYFMHLYECELKKRPAQNRSFFKGFK